MGPIKTEANYKKDLPSATWKEWKKEKEVRKNKKQDKLIANLEATKQKQETESAAPSEPETVNVGRTWTVSIAVPGNILDNAQSPELRATLAGQIARAAAIFNVDEVIVFNEEGNQEDEDDSDDGLEPDLPQSCLQLARILQYLECPQYLRKYFFPIHQDLKNAGLLNPLDAPNHYRRDDEAQFREGYVLEKTKKKVGSMVDVGLQRPIPIDTFLTPGLRVTVEIVQSEDKNPKRIRGIVVSPSAPQLRSGIYWGYNVRLASCLGAVFTQAAYEEGYDLLIGTSERGEPIPNKLPTFKHILIVFGGLGGLERGLESDESLKVEDPSLLFDMYLNTCPNQGSRTIRTEEALLVTLSALQPLLNGVTV